MATESNRDTSENRARVNRIKQFMRDHDISQNLAADIVSLSAGQMRRYMAHPAAKSWRKVDPAVVAVLNLIDEKNISLEDPLVIDARRLTNKEFAEHIDGHTATEVASHLGVFKGTVSRWLDGTYLPSGPGSKFVMLTNVFGWPIAQGKD